MDEENNGPGPELKTIVGENTAGKVRTKYKRQKICYNSRRRLSWAKCRRFYNDWQ